MLVLSRKPNQKIQIGSDITITVVKVRGNVIRLGIDAPREMKVIRAELDLRIDEAIVAGLMPADESSSSEATEGSNEDPGPRQPQVTFARYSAPTSARGLSSVMKKQKLRNQTS